MIRTCGTVRRDCVVAMCFEACVIGKISYRGFVPAQTMNKPRLLVIEDDDLQYELYEDALSDYETVRVRTGSDALEAAAKQSPNAIILDHILDGGDFGLDYLPELKELLPHVPIMIVSGALEVHEQMSALQGPRRAHYVINKPVDLKELKN